MDAHLCTVIGADRRAAFTSFLETYHVGHDLVKWDEQNDGITQYVAFVDPGVGATYAAARPGPLDWRPNSRQRTAVKTVRVVYFSTQPPEFNGELLQHVDRAHQTVVHSLAYRFADAPDYLDLMLRKSRILVGNRYEARMVEEFVGGSISDLLAEYGIELIVITAGTEPILAYRKGESEPLVYAPRPWEGETVPIGAGDSFAAGLIYALELGCDVADALAIAADCGRLAAASQLSYPDLEAVADISKGMGCAST